MNLNRDSLLASLKQANIGYRMITGGNILRHDVINYYDYEEVNKVINADIVHDFGLFVGNHPKDLTPELERFWKVADKACLK